jgi:ribose/xylose/arabinose/galactoside ABC-type transport system permease subunit
VITDHSARLDAVDRRRVCGRRSRSVRVWPPRSARGANESRPLRGLVNGALRRTPSSRGNHREPGAVAADRACPSAAAVCEGVPVTTQPLPAQAPTLLQQLRRRGRLADYLQVASIYFSLLALWIALTFSSPYFFTMGNILNILDQSAVVGMLAAGFTVVLIVGEIDLSITSVQALAGTVAALLIIHHGVPVVPGIVLVVLIGCGIGLLNSYMVVCPRIPSFIATLAMLGIAQGIAFVLTGAREIEGFPNSYETIGQGKLLGVPVPVYFALGVYVVLHLVLSQSRFGLNAYAVGGSRSASTLTGVKTGQVITVAFVLSGGIAALAGIVLSSQLNAGQGNFGSSNLLNAIAAVVIGGTSLNGGAGTVIGTAGGVLMISTINNGLVLLGVDSFWVQVVVGLIILGAVMLDQLFKGKLKLIDLVPPFVLTGIRRATGIT